MFTPPPATPPASGLVVLCGAAASGKSTWARQWAPATSIVSSDALREWLSDDAADQSTTPQAFKILHLVTKERLRRNLLAVVDSTALRAAHRRQLLAHAQLYDRPAYAVLFPAPLDVLLARNRGRARTIPEDVIAQHYQDFEQARQSVAGEGFAAVWEVAGA
jgi:predicted kinase